MDGHLTVGPTKTYQIREATQSRGFCRSPRHLDQRVPATIDALAFTGRTGEPVLHTSVRCNVDAACRRVGLAGVTPHSLRSSFASWFADSHRVLEVARHLPHIRSHVTTRHYARPMTGGDSVVAQRLESTRTGARETVLHPDGPFDWVRSGHDGQISPVGEVAGGAANPP